MLYIGIDLGGTNIATGVVDSSGDILAKVSVKTNADRPFIEIVDSMVNSCNIAIQKANVSFSDIAAIGVGCPGFVDRQSGEIIRASNLNVKNAPLGELLQKVTGKQVFVENDANCAVIAEHIYGAAKGHRNALIVTLGTGVGGGIIIDGKLYIGENGAAGELGHSVIVKDGELCNCGRCGCFQAYCSSKALIKMIEQHMNLYPDSKMHKLIANHNGKISGRLPFEGMRLGDTASKIIIDKYTDYLAVGIGNFISIFRPSVILLGGGICNEGDDLLIPLKSKLQVLDNTNGRIPTPEIKKATLGNDAGIIGAAVICKNNFHKLLDN